MNQVSIFSPTILNEIIVASNSGTLNSEFFQNYLERGILMESVTDPIKYINDLNKTFLNIFKEFEKGSEQLLVAEKTRIRVSKGTDEFLESLKPTMMMQKRKIAELCEFNQATMSKYVKLAGLDSEARVGVNVKIFLTWLKGYRSNLYENFKLNYIKEQSLN